VVEMKVTALAWVVIASPFLIIGTVKGDSDWGPSLVAILWAAGSILALLMPLVLLSFFQPFYRACLFGFLKVPQSGPSAGAAVPQVRERANGALEGAGPSAPGRFVGRGCGAILAQVVVDVQRP